MIVNNTGDFRRVHPKSLSAAIDRQNQDSQDYRIFEIVAVISAAYSLPRTKFLPPVIATPHSMLGWQSRDDRLGTREHLPNPDKPEIRNILLLTKTASPASGSSMVSICAPGCCWFRKYSLHNLDKHQRHSRNAAALAQHVPLFSDFS